MSDKTEYIITLLKNTDRKYLLISAVIIILFVLLSKDFRIGLLYNHSTRFTPDKFFSYRKTSMKKGTGNVPGIYVIYNRTKRMYYVGQSDRLISRVNNHLNGRGNGDVYADYKYGDRMIIKLIPIKRSGYLSLNKMEKDFIRYFRANTKGYNKTKGNK